MREQISYAFVNLEGVAQFGEAVRRFRKLRGLSQQELADLAGCSIMYVSNLERGKETAELGKALKVLDALGVSITFSDRKRGSSGE